MTKAAVMRAGCWGEGGSSQAPRRRVITGHLGWRMWSLTSPPCMSRRWRCRSRTPWSRWRCWQGQGGRGGRASRRDVEPRSAAGAWQPAGLHGRAAHAPALAPLAPCYPPAPRTHQLVGQVPVAQALVTVLQYVPAVLQEEAVQPVAVVHVVPDHPALQVPQLAVPVADALAQVALRVGQAGGRAGGVEQGVRAGVAVATRKQRACGPQSLPAQQRSACRGTPTTRCCLRALPTHQLVGQVPAAHCLVEVLQYVPAVLQEEEVHASAAAEGGGGRR